MKNKILDEFKAGKPTIGTITHMKSMPAVEALGASGLDYIMIDQEHCPVTVDEVNAYMIAAKAADITPIVRIPDVTRSSVLRALDAGAMGIVVPCVETVDQVKDLVKWAKFGPNGERGYCMTRDADWGFNDDYADGLTGYMKIASEQTLLIPQCETMGCLENIETITAMDGVDGIMIGPYDLSFAMGIDGQFDRPEFKEAIQRVLDACKKNGKICIIFTGNPADIDLRTEQGFDSILFNLDVLVVINYYKQIAEDFAKFK